MVIHELAHQWFGNLVTMEWWEALWPSDTPMSAKCKLRTFSERDSPKVRRWDDLWLNEGFATWMQTGVTHQLYPDWHMWEQFIVDMQARMRTCICTCTCTCTCTYYMCMCMYMLCMCMCM